MKVRTKYWNKIWNWALLFAITPVLFYTCQEPDPFPNTPRIYFNNIEYVEILENGSQDSLILYFDFEDGNGDLGLEGFETQAPYNDYNFYYDASSTLITFNQTDVELPITKFDYQNDAFQEYNEDIRPEYDCINYEILYINYQDRTYLSPGQEPDESQSGLFELDTIFLERNPFRNNIEVKYFRKRGFDQYEEIDWRFVANEFGCGLTYDGRFPVLDGESISSSSSLEGTIKYSMNSFGFRTLLRKDTFNIQFRIFDRALNASNWSETGDITLDQLIR